MTNGYPDQGFFYEDSGRFNIFDPICEKVAHVAGIWHFKVEARRDNKPARAFYRTHGYNELETVPNMDRGSVDGVRMEKMDSGFGDA